MEICLREQVKAALEFDNIPNAIFIGERLYACRPSEENAILLAKCYVRNRQDYRAVHVLQQHNNRLTLPGSLLLAQALFRTNQDIEAKRVINAALQSDIADKALKAEFHFLMAMIELSNHLTDLAMNYFSEALKCNPLLWPALEELCRFGKSDEIQQHFDRMKRFLKGSPMSVEISEAMDQTVTSRPVEEPADVEMLDEMEESPRRSITSMQSPLRSSSSTARGGPRSTTSLVTRVHNNDPLPPVSATVRSVTSNAVANRPVTRHSMRLRENVSRRRSANRSLPETHVGKSRRVGDPAGPTPSKTEDEVPLSDSIYYSAEDDQTEAQSAPKSNQILTAENDDISSLSMESENPIELSNTARGIKEMYRLFYHLGRGLHFISIYEHKEALGVLATLLPKKQVETAWVRSKMGCLYMQKVDYDNGRRMFLKARELDPTHFQDMDTFSSMLYLVDDTATLSDLATKLRSYDRLAPETWCAIGNLHSASREHSNALAAFQRAIQLDCHRSYPYTLCGHTYLELRDYDKAIRCFKEAITLDRYHQSGWYGKGMVHFLQSQYQQAAENFEQAVNINPSHAVFRLRYGITLTHLGRTKPAIDQFEMAIKLDENNKDAYMQKGKLHYDESQYALAKKSFEGATRVAHLDPEVYYHLGLACKKMGDTQGATEALYRALDLNPGSIVKANIRAALDKINVQDEDELRKY